MGHIRPMAKNDHFEHFSRLFGAFWGFIKLLAMFMGVVLAQDSYKPRIIAVLGQFWGKKPSFWAQNPDFWALRKWPNLGVQFPN